MKRLLGSMCLMLLTACAVAQQTATPVEPMDQTPVFRVKVVSRTTKAVNYRHRGGSTTVDFKGTASCLKLAASQGGRQRRTAGHQR